MVGLFTYPKAYVQHALQLLTTPGRRKASASITETERNEAFERLEVYKEWFLKNVMRVGQYNTVVVLSIEDIAPRYRDEALL